jgi:hypothetical protein
MLSHSLLFDLRPVETCDTQQLKEVMPNRVPSHLPDERRRTWGVYAVRNFPDYL